MQKSFPIFSCAMVLWVLAEVLGAPAGHAKEPVLRITVVGSTTVLPIATRAAEQFVEKKNGAVSITVNGGGSGVGIQSAGSGRADIGMASRAITPRERKRFKNHGLRALAVGRDAVACVVSSEVYAAGVRALSKKQIGDIYLGKITNWQEVGGPDRKIVVIDKERHRGTRHVFMKYVFGNENARAPGTRLVTGSNNEEQTKIAQSDSAIGMLSLAWINDDVVGVGIQEGDDIIEPTLENVGRNRFPIARDLSLVIAGEPQGMVKEFVDFIMSPEGQKIVTESGYTPVHSSRPVVWHYRGRSFGAPNFSN
jgi:phosphate transport system substrate-binding protein